MKNLSDIYDIKQNNSLKGKANEGFIRPTLRQFLTTWPKFKKIASYLGFIINNISPEAIFQEDDEIAYTGLSRIRENLFAVSYRRRYNLNGLCECIEVNPVTKEITNVKASGYFTLTTGTTDVAEVTDSSFLVFYRDNSYNLYPEVASYTITPGTNLPVRTGNTRLINEAINWPCIEKIDETHHAIAYLRDTDRRPALGVIDSYTRTLVTRRFFNVGSEQTNIIDLAVLTPDKLVCIFCQVVDDAVNGYFKIARKLSGETWLDVTDRPHIKFSESTEVAYVNISKVNDNSMIITYSAFLDGTYKGIIRVIDVGEDGNTIEMGPEVVFADYRIRSTNVSMLDEKSGMITFTEYDDRRGRTMGFYVRPDKNVSLDEEHIISTSNFSWFATAANTEGGFLTVYENEGSGKIKYID